MPPLQAGDPEITTLLLDYGADANKANSRGVAPLMVAIEGEHPGAVEELLAAGADTSKPDANGITPLLAAIQSSNNATVQVPQAAVPSGACCVALCKAAVPLSMQKLAH